MNPQPNVSRRQFIAAAAAASIPAPAPATPVFPGGVIDTHTHFFDPERPRGVPWPPQKNAALYKPTLPSHYRKATEGQGVAGTVVVEASSWPEDNSWLLALAEKSPVIIGVVGRLDPSLDGFRKEIASLAKNRYFRGIRIGTWGFKPEMLTPLDALVEHGLTLDVIAKRGMFEPVLELAARLPELEIIIDHLAHPPLSKGEEALQGWEETIRAAADLENIHLKFSGLVEASGKKAPPAAPEDLEFYQRALDTVWDAFGPERLIFGSNWPVCTLFAPYSQVQSLATRYVLDKAPDSASKVFRENAQAFYGVHLPSF